MRVENPLIFALENFEGPLPLLLHLIQKSEIDIYEIALRDIGDQYLSSCEDEEPDLDQGAEFIAMAAWLNVAKSKALLPKAEVAVEQEPIEEDPYFDIIHHLVDYCRFKGAAKTLANLEQRQNSLYVRGLEPCEEIKKNLGIEHLTLDDLATIFRKTAIKRSLEKGKIQEESWKVADKMAAVRFQLCSFGAVDLEALFARVESRMELIVVFLALLELMKLGEVSIVKETSSGNISVRPSKGLREKDDA